MSAEETFVGVGVPSYCLAAVFSCWLLSDPGKQRHKPPQSAICSPPARPPLKGYHSNGRVLPRETPKCKYYSELMLESVRFSPILSKLNYALNTAQYVIYVWEQTEKSNLRRFGQLFKMPPGCLRLEVYQPYLTGWRTCWRD